MVFVSGVADSGLPDAGEAKGILLGLLTAVLYGCIVLSNKQLRDISAYDRTLVQLFITTLVLIPYCILHGDFVGLQITGRPACPAADPRRRPHRLRLQPLFWLDGLSPGADARHSELS